MSEIDAPQRLKLIQEIERNLWETWSTFGRGPACSLHEEKDALWLETPIPIVPYNGVLRFLGQGNVDQRIVNFVEHFRQRKTQFMWIVHPSTQPTDLQDRLLRHGLKDIEPMFGMSIDLAEIPELPPLPEKVEIRKVADESDVDAFYHFAEWRWHVPDEYKDHYAAIAAGFCLGKHDSRAHMWQAWRGGRPVAKAGMYQGAGSVGIYGVATIPEARGLGLARVLTLTALHGARSSGYELAVLHSTPMAVNLYKSIGFAGIAEFRLFASEEVRV
jgi:ribosomal protein S18 acetylase RimI-like enzyme